MELPDFKKYVDSFSQQKFVEKIARIAKRAGAKLVYAALLLYYTLMSKNVPTQDKALIIGALGYLISPLDIVPDAIPIAGLSDDLTALLYVLHKVWADIDEDIKDRAYKKLSTWFDEEEVLAAADLFGNKPEDNPV